MIAIKTRCLSSTAIVIVLLSGLTLVQLINGQWRAEAHSDISTSSNSHDDKQDHSDDDDDHDEESDNTLSLTARQIEASGITIVPVGRGGGNEIRLVGRVESATGAKVAVGATLSGRVEQLNVVPGATVKAGQVLGTLISGEAAILRGEADSAFADAEVARLAYQRYSSLIGKGAISRQELDQSRTASSAANAKLKAAQAKLVAIGSPDDRGRVIVTSPIAGTVDSIKVSPGNVVSTADILLDISNPAQTELIFHAPPDLASQVVAGTRLFVTSASVTQEALVVGVASNVTENSANTLVRARLLSGSLPPVGSPVAGTLIINPQTDNLTVPAEAIQTLDGQSVVFAAIEGGFRPIPVFTGYRAGNQTEILDGLSGSELIAGTNTFLLKSELAKGEAKHDH